MIGITYQNQYGKQFNESSLFLNYELARNYLIDNGFIEKSKVFYKTTDWGGTSKAFIIGYNVVK